MPRRRRQRKTPFFLHLLPLCPIIGTRNWNPSFRRITRAGCFTDDQKAAIQALSGAHLLYAIPGSGKTAVLTARAGWMIHCGIPAENILIMTFGKKAAEHMADVFRERFPSFSVPFFCTIHSFSYRIIRQAEAEGLIKKYRLIVDEEDDPVPEAMDGEAANAWIVDESPDEVPSGRTKREDKKKGNRYANPRSPIYRLEKILTRLEYCKKQSEARTFAEQELLSSAA